MPHVMKWLGDAGPDVVLLQETKSTDDTFPGLEIGDLGYNWAIAGQKTYNGVAVLSKRPIDVIETALPGDPTDVQARYLEAYTGDVRVASIYLPNGNPVDGDKFTYKLAWMARLHDHVKSLLASEDPFVLGGDYNVAPDDGDVYAPERWRDDALCRPETRAAYRKTIHLGLTDSLRAVSPETGRYTWWDYRGLDNILFVHFNDLLAGLIREIGRVAAFLEIAVSAEALATVAQAVSFSTMKQEAIETEMDSGGVFREGAKTFFFKGTNGRWQGVLSEDEWLQYEQIAAKVLTPDCARWLEGGRAMINNQERPFGD